MIVMLIGGDMFIYLFLSFDRLMAILLTGKEGDTLKKILIPHLVYGPAVIEHCLLNAGLASNAKLHKDFNPSTGTERFPVNICQSKAISYL